MTELAAIVNNLIDHSAEIVIAVTGLVLVWNKLEAIRSVAQSSVDKTDAGNVVIDKIHEVVTAGPKDVRVVNEPDDPANVHAVP